MCTCFCNRLCASLFKHEVRYPIERKVVDTSGRLGSLYDASTDTLIERHSPQETKSKLLDEPFVCRLFSGNESRELIDFLRYVGFDDAMQQSICLQMVKPQGISRLIEYNQSVNENTRFLYYSYRHREEKQKCKCRQANTTNPALLIPTESTYKIKKIIWGIEILFIIQIEKNQPIDTIHQILLYICQQLGSNYLPIQLHNNDRRLIDQLTNITVYGSETCVDPHSTSMLSTLTRIQDWQSNLNFHQPLIYTMEKLRRHNDGSSNSEVDHLRRSDDFAITEVNIIINPLNSRIKNITQNFQNLPKSFSSITLNQCLEDLQQQYRSVLVSQNNLLECFREEVVNIRRQCQRSIVLNNILKNQRYECLAKTEMENFQNIIQQLLNKSKFLETLNEDQIQYINANDIRSNKKILTTISDVDTILERTYFNDNVILWYSSDNMKLEREDEWRQTYQELLLELPRCEPRRKLIYVDFSDFEQKLEYFKIVRFPSTIHNDDKSTSLPPIEINVLLMGETGVGKSTFINAFVNYLKFEKLQQAEQGEPIVLIPVSFLITIGEHFNEFIVKFGDVDQNENYEQQGQSVTQQCKSYVFNLNDRLCLRLIDTPGIGDTRGINQDVKNINHILTYINNLSHLNAICLLLKPNASRLNILFRSCVKQLLTYLTPIGYNNIIFCFTNSRATFYAPGDTGSLLRKMLNDEHLDNIPFKKDNTFCFDSESFRYLAARKCNIDFDDYQQQECLNSWNTSVKESVRLLKHIQTCKPYNLGDWMSPRRTILEISMLARPLMETLRLLIYNWQLNEAKLIGNHIVLNSESINIDMCTYCAKVDIVEIGPFRLIQYKPIISKTSANQHLRCPTDRKHFSIENILTYQFVPLKVDLKNEQLENSFHNFLFKCDQLLYFLQQQESSAQDDPFLPILERYLEEEKYISQIPNMNFNMNQKVREILDLIKQIRQENNKNLVATNEQLSLDQVYRIISELKAIPMVQQQINSIKISRQLKLAKQEIRVLANSINNTTFTDSP
ncbi:unnamed protein product [Rotaria sp. Silwood2]|nr:unnamed protein product [Rotaria sp. Silwood2]